MSLNNVEVCNASGDSCAIGNKNVASDSTHVSVKHPDQIQEPVNTQSKLSSEIETKIKKIENERLETTDEFINKIQALEQEVQKAINERDDYYNKFEETQKKLANLQESYNAITKGEGDEISLRVHIEDLKSKLTQSQLQLNDRSRIVANQENQINALTKQVVSLKEVVQITKDLLNIRNMEVKHLQDDVNTMESRITAERERQNTMLDKMNTAVRLNEDLKKEYETQLLLFQDLRGQYEKKVTLLTEENKALENTAKSLNNSV